MPAIIGALRINLAMGLGQFMGDAGKAKTILNGFAGDIEKVSKRIGRVGAGLTTSITLPILAAGGAAIKMSADFESAMNRLQGASRASADQMDAMEKQARDLGPRLGAGATTAAEAMEVLAKNGLNAQQILGGATEASLLLAAATDSDLAQAADIATDAMLQFNKEAGQLGDVVDGIVGTLFASKFGIDDYRLAIGQAGGVAGKVGVSFEDLNAVLAATSSSFASGSDAGTSFKTFLTRLAPESEKAKKLIEALGLEFFDANGQLKDMGSIAEELKVKLGGLNQADLQETMTTLFGTDSMRTAIALMQQGADGIKAMRATIATGNAEEQAQARLKGFNGQLKILSASVTELAIVIGQSGLLEFVTGLVKGLTAVVQSLAATDPALLKIGVTIAGVAATIGPIALGFSAMGSGMASIIRLAAPFIAAMTGIKASTLAANASMMTLRLGLIAAGAAMATWFLDKDGSYQKFWAKRGEELGIYLAELKFGKERVAEALEKMAIDQAIEEAAAQDAQNKAAAATAEREKATADLIAQIEKLGEEAGKSSVDLDSLMSQTSVDDLRQQIDPLGVALEQMARDLAVAKGAGFNMADATKALAQRAYDAAGGYENLKTQVDRLPASMRALFDIDKQAKDLEIAKSAARLQDRVHDLQAEISNMARGPVSALQGELDGLAQQYQNNQDKLQSLLVETQKLAAESPDAAAMVGILEQAIKDLATAYTTATGHAQQLAAIEDRVANSRAAAAQQQTASEIAALKQRRGDFGLMSSKAQDMVSIENDLAAAREESILRQTELQAQFDQATIAGDIAERNRLGGILAMEQEYFDEVQNTTAAQIYAAENLQDIYSRAIDDIAGELSNMIMTWNGDLGGLVNIFRQIGQQQFLTPFLQGAVGAGGDWLKQGAGSLFSSFGGFFADGGTLSPGQWGIAGENGPERIFAGSRPLSVEPNAAGGATNVYMTVNTPNADSFRRSERQTAQGLKRKLEAGR